MNANNVTLASSEVAILFSLTGIRIYVSTVFKARYKITRESKFEDDLIREGFLQYHLSFSVNGVKHIARNLRTVLVNQLDNGGRKESGLKCGRMD